MKILRWRLNHFNMNTLKMLKKVSERKLRNGSSHYIPPYHPPFPSLVVGFPINPPLRHHQAVQPSMYGWTHTNKHLFITSVQSGFQFTLRLQACSHAPALSDGCPHTQAGPVPQTALGRFIGSAFHTYTCNDPPPLHKQVPKHLCACMYSPLRAQSQSLNITKHHNSSPLHCASTPPTPFTLHLLSPPSLSLCCVCAHVISLVLIPAFQQSTGMAQQCGLVQVQRQRTTLKNKDKKSIPRSTVGIQTARNSNIPPDISVWGHIYMEVMLICGRRQKGNTMKSSDIEDVPSSSLLPSLCLSPIVRPYY